MAVVYAFQAQVGNMALIFAALNGRIDCLRLLLKNGARIDATSNVRLICIGYVTFNIVIPIRH